MLCCKMQLERAGDNNTHHTKRRSCLHYHGYCWDVFVLQLFIVFLPLVLVPFSHAFAVNSTTQVSNENEIDSNRIDKNLNTEFTPNTSLQLKGATNMTQDNYIKINIHNNKTSPEFDEAVESLMQKIFKTQSTISLALISDKHLTQHLFSTVYLGYSNNPFGSSKRYDPKIMKNVSIPIPAKPKTTPASDIHLNTIPDAPDLKLEMEIESPLANKSETRDKRGVINLYNMVSCATGCNPLIYKGYGCYCGFLGSGFPVDGIDRCCEIHDWCYDRANCPMFLEYFVPYLWKCYHGRPICAADYDDWHSGTICSRRLCECDRALSECLRRYECPRRRAVCTTSPWRLIQNTFMIF